MRERGKEGKRERKQDRKVVAHYGHVTVIRASTVLTILKKGYGMACKIPSIPTSMYIQETLLPQSPTKKRKHLLLLSVPAQSSIYTYTQKKALHQPTKEKRENLRSTTASDKAVLDAGTGMCDFSGKLALGIYYNTVCAWRATRVHFPTG